jgi:predicted porin
MKKILVMTALAAAAGTCAAQTAVTLYGIVDAGVTQVSGLKGGSLKQLNSGIMDGSRWGVRGSEDLGGGYRAIFTLESRFELDTGTFSNRPPSGSQLPDRVSLATSLGLPSALQPVVTSVSASIGNTVGVNLNGGGWDRQSFVGLVTPFGAVLAGRQYTPAYEMTATFDTLQTQSAVSAGQAASLPASVDIRLSNTIAYRIAQGGFSAVAMAGAGENAATSGRFYGGNALYKSDVFSVGLGYNTRNNEQQKKSLTSTVFGASVNVGVGTVSALFAQIKDDNPSGLSTIAATVTPSVGAATAALVQGAYVNGFKQDARLMHIGYRVSFGPNTFYVAGTKLDDKRVANADTTTYGVAYSYALSKRTDVNAVVARFVNSTNAQAAPGGAGYLGGVTATAGTDSTSVALGVRHRF